MSKIATQLPLMLVMFFLTPALSAQTASPGVSDANNPNMERFCDPKNNADILAKITVYENQLKTLKKEQEAERIAIIEKINKVTRKLKCTYRPIQD